jgi:drug/metabolite transporter (DMT)-like permease
VPAKPSSAWQVNRRGILAMSLGMACFVVNDSLTKHVSESLPAGQLIFVRGVFATVLLALVASSLGAWRAPQGGLRSLAQRPVLLRAGLDAVASLTYLSSLFHLPLGNATAINMATPLVITLMAVLLLGERVTPTRWLAIGAGFAGVLLIVRPTADGFNAWALLCLLGTFLHASRDLMTRKISPQTPAILITLSTAVSVTLLAAVLGAVQGWQPMVWLHFVQLAAASVFLGIGYYLLIVAMRHGEMSLIAPFRYVGLIIALVLGWAVWGDLPDTYAWCGIALLVGAGLQILRSQRTR